MGFSHVHLPDDLSMLLSHGYTPEMAPSAGRGGSVHIPKAGAGGGASDCPGPAVG